MSGPLPHEYAPYVAKAHEQFRFCSPFRLGIAVGEADASLPSPYTRGSRADNSYCKGLIFGRERRAPREGTTA